MLDFTEGWAWFVGGFAATLLVFLALFVVVMVGRLSEHHARGRRR